MNVTIKWIQHDRKIIWNRVHMWCNFVHLLRECSDFYLNHILCIFLFVFFSDNESRVPVGSTSANLVLMDKIIVSIITHRSLKEEYMWGEISAARTFVSWYRRSFGGSKLISLSVWCLDMWGIPDEGLGIYHSYTATVW